MDTVKTRKHQYASNCCQGMYESGKIHKYMYEVN